jgi:D-glycero-alpha-D-manno-heptose-7-phosphate kinase
MIISRTPFRISFLGGGSDLESYYKHNGGAVLSTSIDKYIYQTYHEYFHDKLLIKYSSTELVERLEDIKHPIIQNVFKRFNISKADYTSIADIPSGTGMGSSSSFTVGLIKLACEISKTPLRNEDIAKMACDIEISDLKEPIGKQDQYAAAVGGINEIIFEKNGQVRVNPLKITLECIKNLENNLILCYTGITRSASSVLKEQKKLMDQEFKRTILDSMVSMVGDLKNELEKGRIDQMGYLLNEGWNLKKSISDSISNNEIDNLYSYGIDSGATGGKLLGAGAGGFVLFYVPVQNRQVFLNKFSSIKKLDFKFEFNGTQIIFNDEK